MSNLFYIALISSYYNEMQRGENPAESEEVRNEKVRVRGLGKADMENFQLVAKDVSKYYQGQQLALNQLCLAVEKYVCNSGNK